MERALFLYRGLLLCILLCPYRSFTQTTDFSRASVVCFQSDKISLTIPVKVLREEVNKRTGLDLSLVENIAQGDGPYIILLTERNTPLLPESIQKALEKMPPTGKDGFRIFFSSQTKSIIIAGRDPRSILYGVGWLLRKSEFRAGKMDVPNSISISTTPQYAIRGHQLGYRPKTNAYDAFTVGRFDQYIRELALFGANSIEIVPPRTDDDPTSRHMTLPPMQMIAEQSRIGASYGLDVWMWYPNMGIDYDDPATVREELKERESVFAAVTKLDAVFVPGGDPGELDPDHLFSWLEKEATVLHRFHPQAKIWVSPQVFRPTRKWMDDFYMHINRKYPWLGGVVFGPWIKTPISEIRARVDPSIPIRIYPDITHSLSSQYPVPDWDLAYAMTLGRECINPRPRDEKHIHNQFAPFASGSISYSEGTNDDVNKFIWSGQDWNEQTAVEETLQDYARFFIGPDQAHMLMEGILGLERNFRGPLAENTQVQETLKVFTDFEKEVGQDTNRNFRFQMFLLRAYYDAFIQKRLKRELAIEKQAYSILEQAGRKGSLWSMDGANKILREGMIPDTSDNYRKRCIDLADSLYSSIGAQLTIQKHGAAEGRGNFIDNIDVPLNDAPWMIGQLDRIAKIGEEGKRLKGIDSLLHRTDAGKGGLYIHFGTPSSKPFVLPGAGWEKDPGGLLSPLVNFGVGTKEDEWVHEIRPQGFGGQIVPKAWMTQVGTLYEQPLQIHFKKLDPNGLYRIRIAYTGRFRSRIKLTANGKLVHDVLQTGEQPLYTFDLPDGSVKDGQLTLTFSCPEGEQGVQVSEIWLLRRN